MATQPMTLNIGDHKFLAVPLLEAPFSEKGAIHVIVDLVSDGEFTLLDIGESADTGNNPLNIPSRRAQWLSTSKTQNMWVGTYLEPVENLFTRAKNSAEHRAIIIEEISRQYLVRPM